LRNLCEEQQKIPVQWPVPQGPQLMVSRS
jgi:hypothetical protein